MTNELTTLFSQDVLILPSYEEKVKKLSDDNLIALYNNVTEFKIYSWAFNCLLSYEAHRRGYSFERIAQQFNCTRQTCYIEAQIWEKIISKAPELLNEPFLCKTFYKRVIELNIPNPIEELWRIAKKREEISIINMDRKRKELPPVKQLSTRQYVRIVKHKADKKYICDKCGERVDRFKKVCYSCFEEL